ncbi:hypothetical protein E2C01_034181 [Portunus trituberculatus]|uniref:Uncharacterized protein n=1 Tax=Portunus trituberculatus TaxID=210409 RepID=A0A5B7F695_PORTR|nr:hypothetical protein [Portunus trituberculatus]
MSRSLTPSQPCSVPSSPVTLCHAPSRSAKMSTRRHLSWRARQGGERLRQESRKAAVSCWQDFLTLRLVPLKITFFVIMGDFATVHAKHYSLLPVTAKPQRSPTVGLA